MRLTMRAGSGCWIGLTVRNLQYEVLVAIVPSVQLFTQPWQPRIARSVFVRQQHARTSRALWLRRPRPRDVRMPGRHIGLGIDIDKRTQL